MSCFCDANRSLDDNHIKRKQYNIIKRFITINKACKDLGLTAFHRNSVPPSMQEKQQIRNFLQEMGNSVEEWRSLKLVVLGHGQIGKTTFLVALKRLLHPSLLQRSFNKVRMHFKEKVSHQKINLFFFSFDIIVLPKRFRTVLSTVGVDIEILQMADGEVTVYDFAGQLEYATTHQFFISNEVQEQVGLSFNFPC